MKTALFAAGLLLLFANHLFADKVDFKKQIQPILEDNCWHCHGEDEQESGLRLDRRNSMLKGGDYGQPAIVPGKPEKSYLLEVVKHLDKDLAMPPDEDKLPASQIELLEKWIEQGAIWPGQMEAAKEEKSDHWSFQPIKRPEVPKSSDSEIKNPIDAFLKSKMKEKGLNFSKLAEARTQIRRASIVLTGLPPTRAEIRKFEIEYAENPNAAYAKLIDRLLDSPHFGERWAQHWLDVIRWAETNGSESNLYRKNAWIYRDYVIRSFNEDKPYDQFLSEQIAGDTMGAGEATGYLVAGPHVPAATVGQEPSAQRQARADRMDEILQTVGASALGLSIGCARCHNHKFDPISIRDYYSMSAVFQDIEFGSRFPEFADDHPVQVRGNELMKKIEAERAKIEKIGGWEENWKAFKQIHFPETKTKSVRITFFWNNIRVDELEIFGNTDLSKNLALAANGGKASHKVEFAQARGELFKVNDGKFGTQAWASKGPKDPKNRPWVQIDFPKLESVDRVRLSSNRKDHYEVDYLDKMPRFGFGNLKIETKDENGKWKLAYVSWQEANFNKSNKQRPAAIQEIQRLIGLLSEEGPQPSFVAKFRRPSKTQVFNRGSPENPRDEVFAAGLKELEGDLKIPKKSSGKIRRTAFAKWVVSKEHPLTARVAANRIWHHIFGRGIVPTTADFGKAGAKPSHPELLDWLASEMMQPTFNISEKVSEGKPWSIKHMIRMMVTSKAFRQSSTPKKDFAKKDADSTLLWRFPPRRLTAEAIRDSILTASGALDSKIGGRSYRIHNVKKTLCSVGSRKQSRPADLAANDLPGADASCRRSHVHSI